MMATNKFEEARQKVWADNSAQAVHNTLKKLFQEESRFRARWVWELLQNARDVSPADGVKVSLLQEGNRVLFRHNGLPFTGESIAHLIYHGSTKNDPDSIGQFGTGFLTTHLISKTVTVEGRTDDGQQFRFLLDRRGNNADELKKAMDESWLAFNKSLTVATSSQADSFTTEYEYPLDNGAGNVITDGIADLATNAGYLLAFNGKIRSLHVQHNGRSVTTEKIASNSIRDDTQRLHFEERIQGNNPTSRHVVVTTNGETSAAVELEEADAHWSIADRGRTPRIFVAFPLTGTRDFCLPVVVNDDKFQPRVDRDTIVLLRPREGQNPNMPRMEAACDLAVCLTVLAAEQNWVGAATLVRLNPLLAWDWVDAEWFRELLADRFIKPLRAAKVMATVQGGRTEPQSSIISLTPDLASCSALWDLAAQMKDTSGRLPRRGEAQVWAENLTTWAPFLDTAAEQLEESLTLDKLCHKVSAWGTVPAVEKGLNEGIDPAEWLNQLHVLISEANKIGLFEQLRLIPSQSRTLKKITELRQDPGIDEELKDISEELGLQTRDSLLDKRMRLKELLELQPTTESAVLTAAVQKFKDRAKSVDAAFRQIAVKFFAWIVRHEQIDKLDGFPVLTRATTDDNPVLAAPFSDPAKSDDMLLAPVACWPEPAHLVADLFPKKQTLSDAYHEALPEDAHWNRVAGDGYVRLTPLYTTRLRNIPFIPDEPLPESPKDKNLKHRTKDFVDVRALAFFEKDDTGLDAVRRSKTRAVNLLLFLSQYVLATDAGALDPVVADCVCGQRHHFYPAAWLVPMWERQWVPLGDSKQSSATAEAIAQLFADRQEELRPLTTGNGRKLLEALKISLADLSLRAVAKDEDTRISLIDSIADIALAAGNDADKVKLIAQEIKQSPQLVDEIRKHRERREKVQRNQSLGAEVERLLTDALRDHNLKVVRTGVGSDRAVLADYVTEEDYIVDDKEVLLWIKDERMSLLVEIKATTGTTARMTVTQAETAVSNKDRFVLCIVRVESPEVTPAMVRDRCRFVMNIGDQVEPVWNEYLRYRETKGEACTRVGDVELIVGDSEVRFGVADGAWAAGLTLEDAVERIVASLAAKSSAARLGQKGTAC